MANWNDFNVLKPSKRYERKITLQFFLKQNQSDNESSGRFENKNLFEILEIKNMVIDYKLNRWDKLNTRHKQKKSVSWSSLRVQKRDHMERRIITGRLRRNTRLIGFPEMKLEGTVEAILELMLTISHNWRHDSILKAHNMCQADWIKINLLDRL